MTDMGMDHLHGWIMIARYMGVKPDAARYLARSAGLPAFKLGTKTVAASRKAIDAWLAEQEAKSRKAAA